MGKFLETYDWPRLTYEEVENLHKPFPAKETDSVGNVSPGRKALGQLASLVSLPGSSKELILILLKLFEILQEDFIRKANIILTAEPEKDTSSKIMGWYPRWVRMQNSP